MPFQQIALYAGNPYRLIYAYLFVLNRYEIAYVQDFGFHFFAPKRNKEAFGQCKFVTYLSPQEKELIDARIALTGLSRSEFFISSCLYQKILVKGNIKAFGEMKAKILELAEAIEKNSNLVELDPQMQKSLRIILEIINSIYGKE